jgi:hypothetical protein
MGCAEDFVDKCQEVSELQVVKSLGLRERWLRGARDWCWRTARFLLTDPNVVAALLLHYALRSDVRDDYRCEL